MPRTDLGLATLLCLGCLGLPGGPLRADEHLIGGQLSLTMPQSDMNGGNWYHGNAALGVGMHWVFLHYDNHALRLRADAIFYPRGPINVFTADGAMQLWTLSAKARVLEPVVEYNFYFTDTRQEGPYLILGLGYSWATFYGGRLVPGPGSASPDTPWPDRTSTSSILYSAGFGVRTSRHLGVEFRFTQANYTNYGPGGTATKDPTFTFSLTGDF